MASPASIAPDFLEVLRSERRDILQRLRQTRFSTLSEGYSHGQVIPHATYSPWYDDGKFMALFEAVRQSTLVDVYRCYELYATALQMAKIPGALVEVGVWRGGTAAVMATALKDRDVHLFDTFSGVPAADAAHDTIYLGGEHADTSETMVAALFARLNLRCSIHRGVFPRDSVDRLPAVIAMAHVDVDTHASAHDAFSAIWPRVSPGGVMIFDDYGFFGCEGVTKAVQQWVARVDDATFIHNLNGHGLAIKQCR